MTQKEHLFYTLDKSKRDSKIFGDDTSYESVGRGNISLITNIEEYRHLDDVLYVSTLKKNLLSVR